LKTNRKELRIQLEQLADGLKMHREMLEKHTEAARTAPTGKTIKWRRYENFPVLNFELPDAVAAVDKL